MKKVGVSVVCSALLIFSTSILANFKIDSELSFSTPKGKKTERVLTIGYEAQKYDHTFTIGDKDYAVSDRPEKYSFALVLQNNNSVWVQEFANDLIKTFNWKVGDTKIRLYKKVLSKPVMGDYILSVGEKDYFFSQKIAQLTFIFDENGVKEIEVDGMVASLGLNKAKTSCPETKEEGAETPEGCEDGGE